MPSTDRFGRSCAFLLLVVAFFGLPRASAQLSEDEFVSGVAQTAWSYWQTGLQALLARDTEASEAAFGQVLALETSPLRLALFAERTQRRTRDAGALLLMEQDAASNALGANARQIYELLEVGREQLNQADDGWYFASIGRFGVARANFEALIASNPDPVALLEFADRAARRHEILVQLADHPELSSAAQAILRLLREGERRIKADPVRIRQNIERLAGPPRAFENAVAHLRDSGEYAVPFLLEALRDRERRELTQPLLRTLPLIGRPALNPLVMCLRVDDQSIQEALVRALGQIGYFQSIPYLLALRDSKSTAPGLRAVIEAALSDLADRGVQIDPGMTAAEAFYRLADAYYRDAEPLAADPRLATANVWYWRDGLPQNIEVPTPIFNEIMAMRCCEEALLLNADLKPALALWLAANFRREAQLEPGARDATRPDPYPSAAYFAQSAGAEYCLRALARAIDDTDPVVALGAIEALRKTAGRAALVDGVEGRHPLAEALSFPDRLVRIQAGLALGAALPTEPFHNSQNLMPVLADALRLHAGARAALVADPDERSANALAAQLRALGYSVIVDANLLTGLQKVREQTAGVDLFVLGSNVSADLGASIAQIRSESRFSQLPVLIAARPEHESMVRELVRGDHRLAQVSGEAGPETLEVIVARLTRATGTTPVTAELGARLALDAAGVLRRIGETDNAVFKVAEVEGALLEALASPDPELRLAVAGVLGFVGSAAAQTAVAEIALNEAEPEPMRLAMFTALAEAAKRSGNRLPEPLVQRLIAVAEGEPNLAIRSGASEALGALNLPSSPASAIIRNQYRG